MEAESLPMIEVDGARIVYRRIGKGRPLVILNGFGTLMSSMENVFESVSWPLETSKSIDTPSKTDNSGLICPACQPDAAMAGST